MLKLRLHGKPDEIRRAVKTLRQMKDWEVLSESSLYPDRAPSQYSRCYVDIDMKDLRPGIDFDPQTGEIFA